MWMFLNIVLLSFVFYFTYGLINNHFLNEKSEINAVVDLTRVVSCCHAQECFNAFKESMVILINSTSQIHSIVLSPDRYSVGRIEKDSFLWSNDCIIEIAYNNHESSFICSGKIRAQRLDIRSRYNVKSLFKSLSTTIRICEYWEWDYKL